MLHNPSKQSYNTPRINKSISIYIPPEFKIPDGIASVWTSFTNDYSSISLRTASSNDPIAPEWWILSIHSLTIVRQDLTAQVARREFHANETQYIRILNVTSPKIAGRYFFKVLQLNLLLKS